MPDIDNRIVKMQFDNGQFESGVKESLSTLDKLKNALDFKSSVKSMQNLSDAGKGLSNSLNFDGVLKGLEQINDRFSIVGMVVQNLKTQAADALTSITTELAKTTAAVTPLGNALSEITTGFNYLATSVQSMTPAANMMAGWEKYADKTQSVQTIMNATGLSIDEVSSQLDKLMWYTDETSYNFNDMASNIGKFTSQGIDLETASTAMMGIANWAGLSGAKVAEASRAMYNISQAMGMGYMSQMDWKSIENANMATQEFKQTVIDAAVAEGTLQEVADGLYVDMKGNEVSVNNFRENLKDGWFDKDVMLHSLQDYGDYVNEVYKVAEEFGVSCAEAMDIVNDLNGVTGTLGERAFRAAQEAKTFGDTVEAIKDAVSSGWMSIFENIFGNYNEAKVVWTWWANELWDVFAGPLDELNQKLSGWHRGITDVFGALDALGISYEGLEWWADKAFDGDVLETFRYLLSDVDTMVKYAGVDAKTALEIQNEYLATTSDGLTGYEAGIEAVWYAWRGVGEILEIVGDAWHEAFPESTVQSMVSFTESLRDSMKSLYDAFNVGDFEYGTGSIEERAEAIGYTVEQIEWAAKNWFQGDLTGAIMWAEDLDYLGISMSDLAAAADKYFNGDINEARFAAIANMTETGKVMADTMDECQANVDKFTAAWDRSENLSATVSGLANGLGIIKDFLGAIKNVVLEPIFGKIPNLFDKLLDRTAKLGMQLIGLRHRLQESGFFEEKLQKIVTWVTGLGKQINTIWNSIKNLDSVKQLLENLKQIKNWFKSIGKGALDTISNFLDDLSGGDHAEGINNIVGAVDALVSGLNWLIDTVQSGYGAVKTFFESLDYSSIGTFFSSVVSSFGGDGSAAGGIISNLSKIGETLQGFFSIILGNGANAFDTGKSLVANLFNGIAAGFNDGTLIANLKTAAGYLLGMDILLKLIQGTSAVTKMITGLADLPEKLGKVLDGTLGVLESYQTELRTESIKNIAIAMIALAGAVAIMSLIPADKFATVIVGLTAVIGVMIPLVNAITKLQAARVSKVTDIFGVLNNFANKIAPMLGMAAVFAAAGAMIKMIGQGILEIAIGIALIAYAVNKDPGAVSKAVSTLLPFFEWIVTILTVLGTVGAIMTFMGKDVMSYAALFASFGAAFAGIGAGLLMIAGGIAIMANCDPTRLGDAFNKLMGFMVMITLMVALLMALALATKGDYSKLAAAEGLLKAVGGMFVKIGAALLLVALAVGVLSIIPTARMEPAMRALAIFAAVVGVIVAIIVGLASHMNYASFESAASVVKAAGNAFVKIGAALLIMALSIAILSIVPTDQMQPAAIALGILAGVIGAIMIAITAIAAHSNGTSDVAASLTAASTGFVKMAAAILIIAGAIALLSNFGGSNMLAAAGVIAGLAAGLGIMIGILSTLDADGLQTAAQTFILAATAFLIIAAAVVVLGYAMSQFESVGQFALAIFTLVGALVALMAVVGVIAFLSTQVPGLSMALSAVADILMIIAMAFLAAGVGVLAFSVGIQLLANNTQAIPAVLSAIGQGLHMMATYIKNDKGELAIFALVLAGVGVACAGLAKLVAALAPVFSTFVEQLGTILNTVVTAVINGVDKLVTAVGNGLGKLISLIGSHLPSLKTLLIAGAALLITGFLEFITGAMGDLVNSIVKLLIVGINSISIAIIDNGEQIGAAIGNLLEALGLLVLNGIKGLLESWNIPTGWMDDMFNLDGANSLVLGHLRENNEKLNSEVKETMSGVEETAKNGLKSIGNTVADGADGLFGKAGTVATDDIHSAGTAVKNEITKTGKEIDELRQEQFDRNRRNTVDAIDKTGETIERNVDGSIIKPAQKKAMEAAGLISDAGTGSISAKIKELGLNYKDMQSWANEYFDGNIQKATEFAEALDRLNSSTEGLKWWADNYFNGDVSAAMEQGLANLQATGKVTADSWEEAANNLKAYRGEGADISDSVAYANAGKADGEAYGNNFIDAFQGLMAGEGISGSTLLGDMDMGQLGDMLSGAGLSFDADSLDLSNISEVLTENGFDLPLTGVDFSNLSLDELMAYMSDVGTDAGETAGEEAVNTAAENIAGSSGELAAATNAAASEATVENMEAIKTSAEEATAAAETATAASETATAAAETATTAMETEATAAQGTQTAAEAAMAAMDTASEQAAVSGSAMMMAYISGINKNSSIVVTTVANVAQAAVNKLSSFRQNFYNTGLNLGQGLIDGLQAKQSEAETAGYNYGKATADAVARGADTASPSKATMLTGKYIGEGLIIGMRRMASNVSATGEKIGSLAVNAMQSTIERIRGIIDGTLEVDPTIRPVLDMSNVTAGAMAMNGLFGNPSMSLSSANLSAIRSLSGLSIGSQPASAVAGSNADIISAIREMRGDIDQLGDRISQMRIVMDSGELVGSIGTKMDRRLGEIAKHKSRGN